MAGFPLTAQCKIVAAAVDVVCLVCWQPTIVASVSIPLSYELWAGSFVGSVGVESFFASYRTAVSCASILPRRSKAETEGDVPYFPFEGWYGET
jgi:hypothetical protein